MVEKSAGEQPLIIDEEFETGETLESTIDEPSQKSSPGYQMETEDESEESSNINSR